MTQVKHRLSLITLIVVTGIIVIIETRLQQILVSDNVQITADVLGIFSMLTVGRFEINH